MDTKIKIVLISLAAIILLILGYVGWNGYSVWQLGQDYRKVEASLTGFSDADKLLSSLPKIVTIHKQAVTSRKPFFKDYYAVTEKKTRALMEEAPERVANWVKSQREETLARVYQGKEINAGFGEQDFIEVVRNLKKIADTGKEAKHSIENLAPYYGMTAADLPGMPELAKETKTTIREAKGLAQVGKVTARLKGEARKEMARAMRQVSIANRDMDELAPVEEWRQYLRDWELARSMMLNARAKLNARPAFAKPYQNALMEHFIKFDREGIDQILASLNPYVENARASLQTAERQVSTAEGRTQRNVKMVAREVKSALEGNKFYQSVFGVETEVNAMDELWQRSDDVETMSEKQLD